MRAPVPRVRAAAGKREYGIHARHLGVYGNGLRARGSEAGKGKARRARSGEADGLYARVRDQRPAQHMRRARQEGEDTLRQSAALHGRADRTRDQLAGARMRRVTLDDNRTARRQRRRRVPTGHREREREVGCTEHCHGTHRHVTPAQIRARQRHTVRQRTVDCRVDPRPLAHERGKELQLSHRAQPLRLDARARQCGLSDGARHQRVAQRSNLLADGLKEAPATGRRQLAEGGEGGLGERTGIGDILGTGLVKGRKRPRRLPD